MREGQRGKVLPYLRPKARLFQGMPPVVLGAIVGVLVLLQLFLIGVSLWHLYRYVLGPRLGWVDPVDRFFEKVRIAASPYRPPQDRDQAIAELKGMSSWAQAQLSLEKRKQASEILRNALEKYETPLRYRYELTLLADLLYPLSPQGATTSTPPPPPSSLPPSLSSSGQIPPLERLRKLSSLEGKAFAEASRERVQLLMELRLKNPCEKELKGIVSALERRPLSPYERGVVLSTREGLRRCGL